MATIHITDIESAINYWRDANPSDAGFALGAQTSALAQVYAAMVFKRQWLVDADDLPAQALQAWLTWYDTTPDTPCIAICSTSQGDDVCKGCGRTFLEVQCWTEMAAPDKRATWRRITLERSAWRFNKYSERAAEGTAQTVV